MGKQFHCLTSRLCNTTGENNNAGELSQISYSSNRKSSPNSILNAQFDIQEPQLLNFWYSVLVLLYLRSSILHADWQPKTIT